MEFHLRRMDGKARMRWGWGPVRVVEVVEGSVAVWRLAGEVDIGGVGRMHLWVEEEVVDLDLEEDVEEGQAWVQMIEIGEARHLLGGGGSRHHRGVGEDGEIGAGIEETGIGWAGRDVRGRGRPGGAGDR